MLFFFLFKQKPAYEMRFSDWSSDLCSSDLATPNRLGTQLFWIGGRGRCRVDEAASRGLILAPQSQSGDERAPEGVTVAEIAAPGPARPLEGATVPQWICPTYSSFLPRRARTRSPLPQPSCWPDRKRTRL